MVLRGSQINPELTLKEAEQAIRQAEEALEQVKSELEAAQAETISTLTDEVLRNMDKEELIAMVGELRDRVFDLEEEHDRAEGAYEKTKLKMQETVLQFASGGLAGAIARTTVAPIDRVKIAMQTAAIKGVEGKHGSVIASARTIISEEGFARLWRGNFTNCIRVIPNTATQFVSYEKYKGLLLGNEKEMTVPKRLMAGALAGMTAATVTHPMDVVRIRLQTQPELKGLGDAVRHVYRESGMRTFYKGYTPAMLSLSPFIAINFATMDTLKSWYYGPSVNVSAKELKKRNPGVILCLGAISGLVAQTCCYPLDTVRRRMQMAGRTYTSTPNAFATIAKVEGFGGFYKGMTANALKIVPNNAIRFAAYEVLKGILVVPQVQEKARPWRRASKRLNT